MIEAINRFIAMYNNEEERDLELLDSLLCDDIEYLGMNATEKADYEWAVNKKQAIDMIKIDWNNNWGKLVINNKTLQYQGFSNFGLFTVEITLHQHGRSKANWDNYLNNIKQIIDSKNHDSRQALYKIHSFISDRINEDKLADGVPISLVLTGVLVFQSKWKFKRLHLAIPLNR